MLRQVKVTGREVVEQVYRQTLITLIHSYIFCSTCSIFKHIPLVRRDSYIRDLTVGAAGPET